MSIKIGESGSVNGRRGQRKKLPEEVDELINLKYYFSFSLSLSNLNPTLYSNPLSRPQPSLSLISIISFIPLFRGTNGWSEKGGGGVG
ncbi:hypothetical protein CR513_60878, partial [Mucuna pruriens]